MKYCSRFYDYLYLDHFDGNIAICPWMEPKNSIIGNLFQQSVDEAYNSEHSSFLRNTMDNQTFEFCRPEACPHIQNNDLPEISEDEYENKKKTKYYPTEINLAYDFVCNQHCETCRDKVFVPPMDYADKMKKIQKVITPCLNKAKRITASGHGDPFASKYMMEVLENLHPESSDLEVLLETNGVFFDEEHWDKIKHLGDVYLEIVVTTNSFEEFTYKHISRGGKYEKVMHNLKFMSELRKAGKINRLSHSFVIQDRNFREIPSFVKRSLNDYAFDSVVLKPVYQWGTMDEEVFWFKDVLNPMHPYHEEYLEIMQDPILKDPRVYNFGGDMVHPARPYPSLVDDKIVPYGKIKKGSKVVVYGAGQVGTTIVKRLKRNKYCEVVLWIDKNGDGECVKKTEAIQKLEPEKFDYVIIATTTDCYKNEMYEALKTKGIKDEKIVFCCS